MIALIGVILMVLATIGLGLYATRKVQTASDFFVAGRAVGVLMNASAISGEYLSAASFMGVAGLIMKNGYDALWYPVGYAAGYLFLLLFIAGPLRRFGAYTIPDFAEGRFDSPAFRKIAVIFVLFIGFFYTMPQMKGAGATMGAILNWPYWVGIVIVGSVITFNVALGGMKGITLVQAFQYWAKLFAICVPLFLLMSFFGAPTPANATPANAKVPAFNEATTVSVKGADAAPANALTFSPSTNTIFQVQEGGTIGAATAVGAKVKPDWPKHLSEVIRISMGGKPVAFDSLPLDLPKGAIVSVMPYRDGPTEKRAVKLEFKKPAKLSFFGGGSIPNAPANAKWVNPYGPFTSKWGYPVLYTFSLIIALVCGTAGLPHILVRFYTNPNGRAARRTTFWVMILLGTFYVFTPMWGSLGRAVMPQLYANNSTDTVLLKLPTMLEDKTLGQLLSAITAAGAFAAFMSTFSGLLVSMSGAFARDIYAKMIWPWKMARDVAGASRPSTAPSSTAQTEPTQQQQKRAFQIAAIGVGVVSMGLGYFVESFDIATMVGWAFAIGAASYFPLLLLGSWWKGLTAKGAATGMLLGGLLSLGAIVANMLLDKKVLTWDLPPLVRSLMEQPAIWGVPLALITMFVVSKATQSTVPKDVTTKMLRLHAPEGMGFSKNYVE